MTDVPLREYRFTYLRNQPIERVIRRNASGMPSSAEVTNRKLRDGAQLPLYVSRSEAATMHLPNRGEGLVKPAARSRSVRIRRPRYGIRGRSIA